MIGIRSKAWPIVLGLLCIASACGGDDDDGQSPPRAGTGSGGRGGSSAAGSGGSAGAAGAASGGDGEEGFPCSGDDDCTSALRCIVAAIVTDETGQDFALPACARACGPALEECQADEMCRTLTGDPSEAFCLSTTTEAFEPCGAAYTAVCGNGLSCLTGVTEDNSPGHGVCIQPCALPNADLDLPPCADGLTCLEALNDPELGLCATEAGRGQPCGVEAGSVCGTADFCIADETSSLCYQDCTESGTCDDGGTCTDFPDGSGRYCD
ncbi:MAG: hypothetical protein ABW321_15355 [Polyangiales bacterium]